jgi:predicted AAA+ superfamily ATPase
LEDRLAEPLTGRHYDFMMLPLSYGELKNNGQEFNLEQRLVYGSYPEVVSPKLGDTPIERIKSIANDYALKDILAFEGVRKSETLGKLLKVLAYQMSGEISFREISANFNLSVQTVQNYVTILEKAFIIFLVEPYGGNPRVALRRTKKIYFYDTGLRNAVINNFDSLDVRPDKGALFENYIMSEFQKRNFNRNEYNSIYFYRSYQGEEVNIITQNGSKILGYECKYKSEKSVITKSADAPVKTARVINSDNLANFLAP